MTIMNMTYVYAYIHTILTIRNVVIHEFYNASAREIRKMQDGLWDSKIALTILVALVEN